MIKLVGYLRVSTTRQSDDGYGLDVQRADCERYAKAHGHRIVAWYQDCGVSGTKDIVDRPGLTDAVQALRPPPQASGLIVARLDRLARALHIQESVLQMVWLGGGTVYTADDGEVLQDDPDDPIRKFIRQVIGGVAELDRALTVKRMRDGRNAKRAKGGYSEGRPPYGWQAIDRELVAVPSEQAALAVMRAERAKDQSYRQICSTLAAEGHRTKRGGTNWLPATVATILARDEVIK